MAADQPKDEYLGSKFTFKTICQKHALLSLLAHYPKVSLIRNFAETVCMILSLIGDIEYMVERSSSETFHHQEETLCFTSLLFQTSSRFIIQLRPFVHSSYKADAVAW